MVLCNVIGHRMHFEPDGSTMRWACRRGCGEQGSKRYATAEDAARYARALNREDRNDLGRRAPLVGLLPLRLVRAIRRRRESPPSHG